MNVIRELAAWALGVYRSPGGIPQRVLSAAQTQRTSIYGAVAASQAVGTAPAVIDTPDLPAGLLDGSLESELRTAVSAAAAYDFDDYLCFGHAGLSSVLVPALLSEAVHADHAQAVAAQVVSAELQARIAGACLLGPYGPTQWCFSHATGAAAAAGLLLGLDEGRLVHALSVALAQPAPVASLAFFTPDTRVTTVADTVLAGVRAAARAAGGMTGPTDLLEPGHLNMLRLLVRRPLCALISGLGHGWALDTLSVKTRASCSYVDPVLDALTELGRLEIAQLESIEVAASLPTHTVENLARRAARSCPLTPATVSFSAGLSAAVLLMQGALTPAQLTPGRLAEDESAIRSLAARIRVRPSLARTARMLRGVNGTFHIARAVRRSAWSTGPAPCESAGWWDAEKLQRFRMEFPVTVKVGLRNGQTLTASREVPRGASGSEDLSPAQAADDKLATWAQAAWGTERAALLERCISHAADRSWSAVMRVGSR